MWTFIKLTNKILTTGVINDPLGQTHSHASSEHCLLLFCFARRMETCAKTIIPTGRDCELAEWINFKLSGNFKFYRKHVSACNFFS